MNGLQHLNRALVAGLVFAAMFAVTAHAAVRPDDRAGTHGVGAQVTGQSFAVRPDDRAGPLGIGGQTTATDESDVISRYLKSHPSATRPDDRAGYRGVGPTGVVTPAQDNSGISWDVVGFAAGSSLGALAVMLAGMALLRRRRSATAALQS
jgi:hypothetical protein